MTMPDRIDSVSDLDLEQDLDRLKVQCEVVLEKIRSIYGTEDQRSMRAQELCNDFQRLRWALSRESPAALPKFHDAGS
jgi:hypothetical protein